MAGGLHLIQTLRLTRELPALPAVLMLLLHHLDKLWIR
jgi:hypothetical protein